MELRAAQTPPERTIKPEPDGDPPRNAIAGVREAGDSRCRRAA